MSPSRRSDPAGTIRRLGAALVLAMGGGAAMAQADPVAVPVLTIATGDGVARVEGKVEGRSEGTVSARLDVTRVGASGRSSSRQGRSLDIRDGSLDSIAVLSISVDPGSEIHAVLTVEAGGREIARAEQTHQIGQ